MSQMRISNGNRVAVVGTGVIGASWVVHFLSCGMDVVATDPSVGAEARLNAAIDEAWPIVERLRAVPETARSKLRFTNDLDEALYDVTFIQENTPEHKFNKQKLMRDIDAMAPAGIVIASSSSGLLPTDLQALCNKEPGRVIVGHPFHPPHLMPLVEVVGGSATDAQTLRQAADFYRTTGKRPIILQKELPGHVANRLQAALWREAFALVEQGAASVEDIDTAMMHGPGLRWALLGPFMTLHLTGGAGGIAGILRHLGPSVEDWWSNFTTPKLTPELQKAVAEGVQKLALSIGSANLELDRDRLLVDLLSLKESSEFLSNMENGHA